MTQAYSDPARESDPHALPNVEVFYVEPPHRRESGRDDTPLDSEGEPLAEGWYWWACFPGCLPDGDPNGPFDSEEAALADAQDGAT